MFAIARRFKISTNIFNSNGFHRHQGTIQIRSRSVENIEGKAAALSELAKSLDRVSENVKEMSSGEIDEILNDVVKKAKAHKLSGKMIQHKRFIALCDEIYARTKKDPSISRAIATYTCFQALNMSPEKFDRNSMLGIIQENINETNLVQVLNLSNAFDSETTKHTPLSRALNYTLPLLFQRQLDVELKNLRSNEKVNALRYIVKTEYHMPDKFQALVTVSESLLEYGNQLDISTAINILYCMSERKNSQFDASSYQDLSYQLIQNATDALINNIANIPFNGLLFTLNLHKKLHIKNEIVHNIPIFFDKVSGHLISQNLGFDKLLKVQNIFNIASYSNKNLLNYFSELIERETSLVSEASSLDLYNLIEAFDILQYKPPNWSTVIWPAIECNLIYNICDENLPYITSSLISLDVYCKSLIETVLSKEFLENPIGQKQKFGILYIYWCILARMQQTNETFTITGTEHINQFIQIHLNNKNDEKLSRYFLNDLGAEKFVNNVANKDGIFLQNIVNVNLKTMEFVDIRKNETDCNGLTRLEDIITNDDEQLVAVILTKHRNYLMNSVTTLNGRKTKLKETIECLCVPTVFLNKQIVDNMQENLRGPYIIQEIRDNLNSKKLETT